MRVGLVVTGGADRSVRERVIPALLWLIERLARHHDVHVFALHHDPEPSTYSLLGAQVHNLGHVSAPVGLRRAAQRRRLSAAVEAIGGVHVLHAYWGMPAVVAAPVAREARTPLIVTADSGEWVSLPDIQYGLQRRWQDRRAVAIAMREARVVTVCTNYMHQLGAQHGVDARVIPLGVPRHYALHTGPDPSAYSRTPDRPPEGPPWRLMHVASINPVKDHDTLLRAMAALIGRHPDVHLDIVGADVGDGAAARIAHSLGLDDHVTFHGFLPSDLIEPLWARAHLHVVSSRHEAAGVVTLEAAMAGVATVGTRVGYIADGAPDRAAAVPVGNPAALADAMAALLTDPARRHALAAAARDWAYEHDADHTATMFDRLYREVTKA